MRTWPLRSLLPALAVWILLAAPVQPQVMPFPGYDYGANLSPEDSRLLFESIERLNAAEPSRVGRSELWSNPQTKSSGTSKITRIFRSGGMPCHRVRTHIVVAGQTLGGDYRLTWCRTSTGEWKTKG